MNSQYEFEQLELIVKGYIHNREVSKQAWDLLAKIKVEYMLVNEELKEFKSECLKNLRKITADGI